MYTEVRELVNFLARYLFGREPRRPAGIFTAELGNFLVIHYAQCGWDITNPKNGEKDRVLHLQCSREGTTKFLEAAAGEAGLEYNEIINHFPKNLRIFANPGEVFMRANDVGIDIPIWMGDVNADNDYQPIPEHVVRAGAAHAEKNSNMGAAGTPVLIGQKQLPTTDRAVLELVSGCYVPLTLEEIDDVDSDLQQTSELVRYRFVFKPHSSQTFTGIEFSQTRFGSSKSRPDLQTMLSIKQMVANQNGGQPATSNPECSSSRSSSPTPDQPYYPAFF